MISDGPERITVQLAHHEHVWLGGHRVTALTDGIYVDPVLPDGRRRIPYDGGRAPGLFEVAHAGNPVTLVLHA